MLGGLLALASGLVLLAGMIWQLLELGRFLTIALRAPAFWTALVVQGLAIVLLLAGGALLCLRVGAGRFMNLAGTVLLLVLLGLSVARVSGFISEFMAFHVEFVPDLAMLAIVLALGSSLLGLLPATARWVSTLRT